MTSVESGNPIPENGLVGRLTESQYESLRGFWREFFKLIDSAPDHPNKSNSNQNNSASNDQNNESDTLNQLDNINELKDSSDLNDDSNHNKQQQQKDEQQDEQQILKEKMRSEQELRDAKLALIKYGKIKFLETFWGMMMMDDPDVIVLKFLRARKWNVSAGVAMMAACMKWRLEYKVDEILKKSEEGFIKEDSNGFLNQLKMGKAFVQGTDRQGRPVVYINVRFHKASDQSMKILEDFIVYSMEVVRMILTPPLREKATIVIDMTGFGMANMDWKSLAFIVKCLESYYPESLNVLLVHNPPWVFYGLWKVIAPMLDPVVRSKIVMTKTSEELKVHIDEIHLIDNLGGKNKWKWEYEIGTEEENHKMKDEMTKKIEIGNRKILIQLYMDYTRKWIDEAMIVNQQRANELNQSLIYDDLSVNGLLRKFISHHLRVHYFVLDPYIRGRTIYHRKGTIIGNGLITFDYPRVKTITGEEIDYWEVLGYDQSKENLMIEIEKMKIDFQINQIEFPSL